MRVVVLTCLLILVIALAAPKALAARVVLVNGASLSGRIARETAEEIDLILDDGMRMTIRRSRIKTIVKEEGAEPEPGHQTPDWTPLRPPAKTPGTRPDPEPDRPTPAVLELTPGPFENSEFTAWNRDFCRYPVIMAAKITLFPAYNLIRKTPLSVDPTDKRYAELFRRHGHGGALAVWEFEYAGMQELRFGDQVRFIAEITSPTDTENQFIRLKAGPTPIASRLVVILVKRNGKISRYATPAVFAPPDFRQAELKRVGEYQLNVRTYQDDYAPIASTWLEPVKSDFLSGIDSPMGESVRMEIERYRFQLDWFATPQEERPPLDPDLLSTGSSRPLARPGRPVATEKLIRRAWGSATTARARHNQLVKQLRTDLSSLGIKPDRNYIVECERIGVLGAKGVSIETRRYYLSQELMEDLLTPR